MNRVLVTGATGFIGLEVARQLAVRGLNPRVMVRRPQRGPLLRTIQAEVVQGDLESPASLRRAVSGVDTVFHLAARASFERYGLLRPSIVDGSVRLMEAAVQAGVRRFIYSGSLLVYGARETMIDGGTQPRPVLDYGRAKLEAEERLSQIAQRAGMIFASLRLPHVYGARDLLFEQVRRGLLIFPGSGETHFAHLHVEDSARLMIAVAENDWSGISPVSDDLSVDWNTFFGVIREYYPRFRLLRLPRRLGLLGTSLLSPLQRFSSAPSLFTPGAVTGWNLNLPVKPGLVREKLGLDLLYPTIHQGIPAVLDDCVAFRWLHSMFDTA